MDEYASRSDVVRFLTKVKGLVDNGQRDAWQNRAEMRQCLTDLEFQYSDLWALMRRLKVSEYHRGPEADDQGRGAEVWIFFPRVKGNHFYLKLWLHKDKVICMSFKPARPREYCPYQ